MGPFPKITKIMKIRRNRTHIQQIGLRIKDLESPRCCEAIGTPPDTPNCHIKLKNDKKNEWTNRPKCPLNLAINRIFRNFSYSMIGNMELYSIHGTPQCLSESDILTSFVHSTAFTASTSLARTGDGRRVVPPLGPIWIYSVGFWGLTGVPIDMKLLGDRCGRIPSPGSLTFVIC